MKSIIIIGKGPSINRCKKEYVNTFDEVAICGHPIFKGYEHLIGNRAHLDFCNCVDPRPYPKQKIKDLGIKVVYNTGKYNVKILKKNKERIAPDGIKYIMDCRSNLENYFKTKYNLDPATGTLALETIIREGNYNKIGIIGFDLMETGEDIYYFPRSEVQSTLQYLFSNGTYTKNGKRKKPTGHNLENTFKYMVDVIKNNPQIQFEILSNRKFPNLKNLLIL